MCEEQVVMSVYKKYHDGVLLKNMERTLKSEGFYRSEKVGNISSRKDVMDVVVTSSLSPFT